MEKRLNNSEKDRLIATLDKLQHSLYGYMDPTSVAEVNNVVRFVTKAYRYYSSLSQRLHLIDVIETAQILADMLFGCNIIIGCLLKDILSINEQCGDFCWLDDKLEYVDETVIFQQEQQDGYAECMEFVRNCCNYSYLRDNFGKEMAEIASLSAKINIIDHQEIDQKQSHKIRQFFLSFSQCQEVIIIKLAEKIHLFGIINTIFNHDQKQEIARDMLEIYAPLAARFGLYRFKEILEDGSFAILYPGLRESLLQRITYLNAASKIIKDPDAIGIFMENIYNAVSMTGISVIVDGREKETYSIWKKMKGKKTKFERLSDIFAVRIITDTLANCYQILGIIHSTFSAVSEKFKDYISNPKANGYKSIHTVVLGPNLHPIEIQIRTEQMHREAEFGDAAHWLYKQVDLKQSALKPIEFNNEKKPVASAANTLNQYDSPVVPTDEHDLFCFTPTGDIIALPAGSIALDFAFHIHSCIGVTAFKAKINNQIKPLYSKLKNGDQVEIMCKSYPMIDQEWLGIVASDRARNILKKYIKESADHEFESIGRQMLIKKLATAGINYSKKIIRKILPYFGDISIRELLNGVGHGTIDHDNVVQKVRKHHENSPIAHDNRAKDLLKHYNNEDIVNFAENSGGMFEHLMENMAIHRNDCCYPLPGERIMGIFMDNNGLEIHKVECLRTKIEDQSKIAFEIEWSSDGKELYNVRIRMLIANKVNSLATISSIIGKHSVNIVNFHIITKSIDFYEAVMEIEVKGCSHLDKVLVSLSTTDVIYIVERL